jgi:hypothetical protein
MAGDGVAEVDRPGEIGGGAVGVVGEAGEEASDAADGDAEGEGDGVEVAGGVAQSDVTFGEFDADEAEDESAHDGLAAEEIFGVVQAVRGELGVFEPEQDFCAECASGHGGGDDGPAQRCGQGISEAAAKYEIDAEGDDIGERFEEEVGMNNVGAKVEIDREDDSGMEPRSDGEL